MSERQPYTSPTLTRVLLQPIQAHAALSGTSTGGGPCSTFAPIQGNLNSGGAIQGCNAASCSKSNLIGDSAAGS